MRAPRIFWRLIRIGPRVAYALGLGPLIGRFVLLLTTYGRRTGRPRVTPLVYERLADTYRVASARGPSADWLRNVKANPNVVIQVGRSRFDALAEVTDDAEQIADCIERQTVRNPRVFGIILRSEGLPSAPGRADLVRWAPKRPMVIIRPIDDVA
jgi:deazaflavin-dependent oxidoreductase (nitroreductase family)